MINFKTRADIDTIIEKQLYGMILNKTKRDRKSINLRSLVYDCIRATYYQIIDAPIKAPATLDFVPGFWLMGPVGTQIHDRYQKILGLDKYKYTEKYMSFNTFAPIAIKTRSDGFDTDNHIVYEIKTKTDIPNKPYEEELTQCVYNAWLFAYELKMEVNGLTMLYASRSHLDEYELFHYNLIDPNSDNYLDVTDKIATLVNKMAILNNSLTSDTAPAMSNEYIKLEAFGKDNCKSCVYREVCKNER